MSASNPTKACRPRLRYAGLLSAVFALYLLFVYLNYAIGSNIAFAGTMLFEITEVIYAGIEQAIFFVVYAYAIYHIFTAGWRAALQYAGIYAALSAVRHTVLLFMFGLDLTDLLFDALMTLANIFLELGQYALIFVIALCLVRRFDRTHHVMQKGAAQLGREVHARSAMVYPYRTLPWKSDPLRTSTLATAILISLVRVLGRIIYDISIGPAVDLEDALWMVTYYTVDVLIGVAGYFVILYILRRLRGQTVEEYI